MEFRLLGPLEVVNGGVAVRVGGLRQRTLLATLLLHRGRVVSLGRLVDAVWDADPPSSARMQIRNSVWALRRSLGDEAGRVVVTEDAGYRLDTGPHVVDADRFEDGVRSGRAAAAMGDSAQASTALRAALELWRGPVLAGIRSRLVREAAAGLDERRLGVLEEVLEADLALGRHAEVVGELTDLVGEHPGRTRILGQLMLALYRTGRPGDALACYQRAKRHLADDLGLDPPGELRELEGAILRDDPDLATLSRVAAPGAERQRPRTGTDMAPVGRTAGDRSVPRMLPYDVPDFIGRPEEFQRLLTTSTDARAVVITAIEGMAGVGKTALAVHAAHALADRFPDGQLFIDLHGFTPDRAPTSPEQALETLLRAIGVPGSRIPSAGDERVAMWRTELADRRLLVVLDNAADVKQVSPLIPGSPGCLVLVTSRRRLTSLDGATPVMLDILPEPEAIELVTAVIGASRANSEPQAVGELVKLCGHLPLAIRIAAARLQHRPQWTVSWLVDRMGTEKRRLTALTADAHNGVTTAFTLSYQAIPADQQRLFRLLGLHPGTDIDPYAAAALAGLDPDPTEAMLEQLADEHLLHQPSPGRYTLHDLLRAHAHLCAMSDDPEPVRHDALTRLFDHYLYAAANAVNLLDPHEENRRPPVDRPNAYQSPFQDNTTAARDWLDRETTNLLTFGSQEDWPTHTCHLSVILWRYLEQQARHTEAQALHAHAVTLARATANQLGEASALRNLGRTHWYTGNLNNATQHFERALALFDEHENHLGTVTALNDLATTLFQLGGHEEATVHCQRALAICDETSDHVGKTQVLMTLGNGCSLRADNRTASLYLHQALRLARDVGNRNIEARAHLNIGDMYEDTGLSDKATHHLEHALTLYREIGNREGEAATLANLGRMYTRSGHYDQASQHLERALAFFHANGDRRWQSVTLREIGAMHSRIGHHDRADHYFDAALKLTRQVGNLSMEAEILNCLGETARERGEPDQARSYHHDALITAHSSGRPHDEARACRGLGHAHHDLGEPNQARRHWQRALDMYTELGVADADDVRTWIAGLDQPFLALDQGS